MGKSALSRSFLAHASQSGSLEGHHLRPLARLDVLCTVILVLIAVAIL